MTWEPTQPAEEAALASAPVRANFDALDDALMAPLAGLADGAVLVKDTGPDVPSGGPVTFGHAGTGGLASGAGPATIAFTTTATETYLLVGISARTYLPTITSVAFGATALTKLGEAFSAAASMIGSLWGGVVPASTTANVVVTIPYAADQGLVVGIRAYIGVVSRGAAVVVQSGTATSSTVTFAGDVSAAHCVDMIVGWTGDPDPVAGAGQVQELARTAFGISALEGTGKPGAATMTYTGLGSSGNGMPVHIGVPLYPGLTPGTPVMAGVAPGTAGQVLTMVSGAPAWAAAAGGTTRHLPLRVEAATLPDGTGTGNAPASMGRSISTAQTTNTPKVTRTYGLFGPATDTHLLWTCLLPTDYGSGGTLRLKWTASPTTGAVVWKAGGAAIVDGAVDSALVFAAADSSGAITVPGTTLTLTSTTIALTRTNWAPLRQLTVFIGRDADHASDTAAGDAYLLGADLEYTKA